MKLWEIEEAVAGTSSADSGWVRVSASLPGCFLGRLPVFPHAPSLHAKQEHQPWHLRLVAYLGTSGNDIHATWMWMQQSVSQWGRPGALRVHRLPACVSGAHGTVDDWSLSCVEVGWENGLQHLACLPNPVLTPRGSLKPPIFCFNGTENGPAFPFLLCAFSSQRLSCLFEIFLLQTRPDLNLPPLYGIFCGLCYFGVLCFSALWCEDAVFIKKALVSFKYNAFLN